MWNALETWEGVALGLLRELGDPEPAINALGIAGLCGVRVEEVPIVGARLDGNTIEAGPHGRCVRRLHSLVAHELGHWALRRAGEQDSEQGATYVGGAIMLPRRAFLRDMRATGRDIRELARLHAYCGEALIAWRISTLATPPSGLPRLQGHASRL